MDSRKDTKNKVSPERLKQLVQTMPECTMVVLDLSGLMTGGKENE